MTSPRTPITHSVIRLALKSGELALQSLNQHCKFHDVASFDFELGGARQ